MTEVLGCKPDLCSQTRDVKKQEELTRECERERGRKREGKRGAEKERLRVIDYRLMVRHRFKQREKENRKGVK